MFYHTDSVLRRLRGRKLVWAWLTSSVAVPCAVECPHRSRSVESPDGRHVADRPAPTADARRRTSGAGAAARQRVPGGCGPPDASRSRCPRRAERLAGRSGGDGADTAGAAGAADGLAKATVECVQCSATVLFVTSFRVSMFCESFVFAIAKRRFVFI